jgi:uncharacterized membrane protein
MALLIIVHLLGAIIWVGGMFFAIVALRPASVELLEPPQRLRLWRGTLQRFFRWVWLSVVALLGTGYGLIGMYGGMANVGIHIHIMHGVGLLMVALFAHLFFAPYRRLGKFVDAEDFPAAAANLNTIRIIVLVNLVLGLFVASVGVGGRFFV